MHNVIKNVSHCYYMFMTSKALFYSFKGIIILFVPTQKGYVKCFYDNLVYFSRMHEM